MIMFVIFFILGLIVGSFLNVVVYRLNLAESIWGRSHCPKCRAKIRWYDNIPVASFIILGTKCRDCGEPISWQYPIVELFTGVVFAATGNYFFSALDPQSWLATFYYLVIFSLLLVIFVYDFKFMEIPMIVVWLGVGVAVVYNLLIDWMNFNPAAGILTLNIFSGALGAALAFLFFFILVSVSRERWMGMGDAHLAILVGLVLGWPTILLALILAFGIGAVVGVALIAAKKKTMQSQIPFAPFLVTGAILAIFIYQAAPSFRYWFWFF